MNFNGLTSLPGANPIKVRSFFLHHPKVYFKPEEKYVSYKNFTGVKILPKVEKHTLGVRMQKASLSVKLSSWKNTWVFPLT